MKISGAETLRFDELPNVLWVLVHTDKGLARADKRVAMRAARVYELGDVRGFGGIGEVVSLL